MLNCVVVGLGGFIGSVIRYLIGLIPIRQETAFPYKTLIINVIGAFVIGCVVAVFAKNGNLDSRLLLFLKVGICGGFTTFSTFSLETLNLFKAGSWVLAVAYILASVVLSVAAVFAGQVVFK